MTAVPAMRRYANFLACAGLCLLAGCSSLNPFASKKTPREQPAPLTAFKPSLDVKSTWSAKIGSTAGFFFRPAALGSDVVVANLDGDIVRLDGASGRAIWRIRAGTKLTAGVGAGGDTIAVAGTDGVVLAFDGNGKQRWKARASSQVLSTPAVGQGLVIVRSIDNHVSAFDIDTGERKWIVQRAVPPLTLRTAPGIVINGQVAYAALPGGRLSALTLRNGGPIWEVAVGEPRGTTELERIADLSGDPVIVSNDVCAVAYQGRIGCFALDNGAVRWIKDFSSESGLGANEQSVFSADENGVLFAFDRATGKVLWQNNAMKYRRPSAPADIGPAIAFGDYAGYVHFLSPQDGTLTARMATDGSRISATPIVVGGRVVVQTQSGTVTALTAR